MKYIVGRKKKKKGFTLMELLVSLGIIAALSMMVAPMIMGKVEEAKIKADISNANAIAVAVKSEMLEGGAILDAVKGDNYGTLASKYFDGQMPQVQSIKGKAFDVNISNNSITIMVDTAQFYPVNETTLPNYVKPTK